MFSFGFKLWPEICEVERELIADLQEWRASERLEPLSDRDIAELWIDYGGEG